MKWSVVGNVHVTLPFCMLTEFSLSNHLPHDLTEQYTEKQEDTATITGEISGLDTDGLESSEEATRYKDSMILSLADGAKEVIPEECLPEEESLDVTIEEYADIATKDDSEKSTATTTIHGQNFTNVRGLNICLGFSNELPYQNFLKGD